MNVQTLKGELDACHEAHEIDIRLRQKAEATVDRMTRALIEMRDIDFGVSGRSLEYVNDWFNQRARQALEMPVDGQSIAEAPEPPWPVGADTNCKREGWSAFFDGKPRQSCPFPRDRKDLQRGYVEGWDAAWESTK